MGVAVVVPLAAVPAELAPVGVPEVLGSALAPPWLAVTLWRPLVVPPCLLPCPPPTVWCLPTVYCPAARMVW